MDFSYSTAELDFRDEVRDWIKKNIRGDYGSPEWPVPSDPEEAKTLSFDWMKTLQEGGLVGNRLAEGIWGSRGDAY